MMNYGDPAPNHKNQTALIFFISNVALKKGNELPTTYLAWLMCFANALIQYLLWF